MNRVKFKDVALRHTARREIERQVEEFLKKGGEIHHIESKLAEVKPKGAVWRPYGGLDS